MSSPDTPSRKTIGPYQIVARVGAGGMGEVFKAWDPRLEREVAVKVLHSDAAGTADHQRQLLAEGRAASALNHPNILRVYDADVDGTTYYLVSEWLEGRSLRDELSRGPLPVKRLLDLAVQIADGLAAAHAMGIVHRDIKPENVMLARDGTARIVDFGLARLDPRASARSEAAAQHSTVTLDGGLSGTPAYMSPEQARGTQGDFRTDQFSFGVLLYEMATGEYAFRRDSMAETLAAVLREEPKAIAAINRRVPSAVIWIVEQCLAKDATERYAATEDLARELRRVRERLREAVAETSAGDVQASGPGRWRTLLTGTAALAAGVLIGWPLGTAPAAALRFTPLASASAYEGQPAWSADGQSLAYVADVDGVLQVFVRRIGDALSHQVTRTRFDATQPFWAPNSQVLYYISLAGERDALWSVSVAGGTPELVFENVAAAAIDPSSRWMALARNNPESFNPVDLWWSTPPGADPVKESQPPFDRLEGIAARLAFNRHGQLLIWLSGVAGSNMRDLWEINSFHLFDAPGTPPRRVLAHLSPITNLAAFSWLPDGRHVLLALADQGIANRHLWVADVRSETVERITATHTNETDPAAAPVGGRVAYATDEVDFDLVLVSPDGRSRQSLLSTARNEFGPAWSPAGDQFAFITDRSGRLEIWSRSRDGQWERPIVTPGDFGTTLTESMGSLAFSPDGRLLAYQRSSDGAFEVWLSPVTGGKPVRLIDSTSPNIVPYQDSPSWSPDGQWVAFREDAQQSARGVLKKIRVGSKEAIALTEPLLAPFSPTRWSPDGRVIACQLLDGLAIVAADGGATTLLAEDAFLDFAWAPDGRHLFALAESEVVGHFALVEIDTNSRQMRVLNPDVGSIPVANQPIRGFSYLPGHGFLTSLASARSDVWILEGLEPPAGWIARILARFR